MSDFFALISRMRYISRWGLMRSSIPENVQEHSHMVAVIAHALGVIRRDVFGEDCDAAALALAALYHDAPEILTGDMPTPIKYHSGEITAAYREVERAASDKLVNMLPVEFRREFAPIISGDVGEDLVPLLKCADRLSAYIKCVEERKAGNLEFLSAERQTLGRIRSMGLREADYEAVQLPFVDAAAIQPWALPAVKAMYALGIMQGNQETDGLHFGPGDTITRAQAITMLGRLQEKGFASDDLSAFSDSADVASWALPYVQTMVAQGILSGSDGKLSPNAPMTRSQACKVLYMMQ